MSEPTPAASSAPEWVREGIRRQSVYAPEAATTVACARCGLPALGFATIGDQRVCHSDEERPSCYELGLWDQAVERMQGERDV
jgi:hypothetical protein